MILWSCCNKRYQQKISLHNIWFWFWLLMSQTKIPNKVLIDMKRIFDSKIVSDYVSGSFFILSLTYKLNGDNLVCRPRELAPSFVHVQHQSMCVYKNPSLPACKRPSTLCEQQQHQFYCLYENVHQRWRL